MFTGLVEDVGEVVSRGGARLVVSPRTALAGTDPGSSLAVNGVCLTVAERGRAGLHFDLGPETLDRTALGDLRPGDDVNLERPLSLGGPVGGHLVQGHVDARGKFLGAEAHGGSWTVRIAYPPEIARYLVFKGSVAVEGISLTIAELADECFEIAIIPKTWEVTNFSHLRAGDEVNLEADVIAKYVERILSSRLPLDPSQP